MDLRRSAAVEFMQFDVAGTLFAPVKWYVAPPGAIPMPGPHLFCADIWNDQGRIDLGPGVYWQQIPTWSNGALPAPFSGQGPPCGQLDWWTNGVPSDAPPLDLDARGVPLCCHVPVIDTDEQPIHFKAGQVLCQSWHIFGPPTRTLKQLSTGQLWVSTTHTTTAQAWHGVTFPADTVTTSGATGTGCFGFGNTGAMSLRNNSRAPVGTYAMTLRTYNPATKVGVWQVASTAPYYTGEFFEFTNPT